MKIVELFCGTKSISKVFKEAGHDTFTVDNDIIHRPDLLIDILKLQKSSFPKEFQKPDVVWASPPCQTFSVASIGQYWRNDYRPSNSKCALGIAMVLKTVELIKELNPENWFIENPVGVLRKLNLINGIKITVTYCRYGDNRMKPTDIWNNFEFLLPP